MFVYRLDRHTSRSMDDKIDGHEKYGHIDDYSPRIVMSITLIVLMAGSAENSSQWFTLDFCHSKIR